MGCQPKYISVYFLICLQPMIPYQITIVKRIYRFGTTNFYGMRAKDKLLQHL